MKTRSWGFVWILFFAVVAVSFGADKKFDKSFTVSGAGTLTIGTDVGSVKIVAGEGKVVKIMATVEGRDRDVERYEISAEQIGSDVNVRGKLQKSGFWNNVELNVQFVISVPKEFRASIGTSGGDIEVSGLAGPVKGETSGGDVRLTDISGSVEVETSGGSMHAEKVTGNVKMETSGGDVIVSNASGSVSAETSGGNIRLSDISGNVHAETSGGNVSIKVRGPNQGIHAETSGGNIEIMIAKNAGAALDAGTSGGEVICDLPVTVSGRMRDSSIKGTVNGGGSLIYAHTSGGNVRIRGLD
jgi:hypothetical protein